MPGKPICPICEKRRAERFCPAKGERICAIDCGTEREVSIDCPVGCAHLQAAHRWERDHPKPLDENQIPFPDVAFPEQLLRSGQPVLSGFVFTVLVFARDHQSLNDADIFAAAKAAAETHRTLVSGIYYEKPPQYPLAGELYAALMKFIDDEKKRETAMPESTALNEEQYFHLLVLFLRLCQMRTNGKPLSRSFLEFLRFTFQPSPEPAQERSRIIMP